MLSPASSCIMALFLLVTQVSSTPPNLPKAPPDTTTYSNPLLHLTLYYPSDLQSESIDSSNHFSYRSRFALHSEDDPQHLGADPCSPLVLAIGMGPDRPVAPERKSKSGKQVPILPTGGVSLSEIKKACLLQDYRGESPEDALASLVDGVRHHQGLAPLAQTITYKVQGKFVTLAVASGPSADEKGKRTGKAGWTFVGSIGAVVDDRILLWGITANDRETFNRLLHMQVCFDPGICKSGYEDLVPFKISTASDPTTQGAAIPR